MIVTSVVLLLAMSGRSVAVVIAGFVLGGLAYSGVTPTNSAFCRAYFGAAHYPVNFPLINSNLIFASFGSTISGALYELTDGELTNAFPLGVSNEYREDEVTVSVKEGLLLAVQTGKE